jgi:hypothetical protein
VSSRDDGKDVTRSPYEQLAFVLAPFGPLLNALFLWSFAEWFPWPVPALAGGPIVLTIVGTFVGARQGRRFNPGYGRFGAALGFLLAGLLGFAANVLLLGLALAISTD